PPPAHRPLLSLPTRRSSDLVARERAYPVPDDVADETLVTALHPASTAHLALHRHGGLAPGETVLIGGGGGNVGGALVAEAVRCRSEEHTSELQSRFDLVCRL